MREMDKTFQIQEAEERLIHAMRSCDVETLDALLSDDAIFTNHLGMRLTKTDDLNAHRSGLLKIERLQTIEEPLIRLFENTAFVCVAVDLAGSYDGQPFGGKHAYSRLWHLSSSGWRIEAAHSSAFLGS